jgi:hypothetical protein
MHEWDSRYTTRVGTVPQSTRVLIERLYDGIAKTLQADAEHGTASFIDAEVMGELCSDRETALKLLWNDLEATAGQPSALVLSLMDQTRRYLQTFNQFETPSEETWAHVSTLLTSWLRSVHDGLRSPGGPDACAELVNSACQALTQDLEFLRPHGATGRILSEEYSVETQLRVLHLEGASLKQPVLDVGCGHKAVLVRWLHNQAIHAIGIDVLAPQASGCIVADWFQFPWLPEQFGTVVAHQSFSLHFLHQHLRPDGNAEKYARQFMLILNSLMHCGRLVYAPGLPFIERHLPPAQYKVARYAIECLPVHESAAKFLSQNLGESPMYACHVERA